MRALQSFEFQIADDTGALWSFSVYIPGFDSPLAEGDIISVTSSESSGGALLPPIVNVTVRDENGALLFYVGDGAAPGDLTLPDGLTLALGDPSCGQQSDCGAWQGHPFVIHASDASVDVPYRGSATLFDYRLVHGGAELQTKSSGTCSDWIVAHVALGITSLGP